MIALGKRAIINPLHVVSVWTAKGGEMFIVLDNGETLRIKNKELAIELWGCLAKTVFECEAGDIQWMRETTGGAKDV
jgi:hypothetical protein